MTFSFDNSNTFRNVGIGTLNNKVIIMNVSKSTDNLSFHSTTNDNNINIMNIKTILNKDPNNDLHICTYNGNFINPIIKINNTNSNCNITSNLNISGNLNISDSVTVNGFSIMESGFSVQTLQAQINYLQEQINTIRRSLDSTE